MSTRQHRFWSYELAAMILVMAWKRLLIGSLAFAILVAGHHSKVWCQWDPPPAGGVLDWQTNQPLGFPRVYGLDNQPIPFIRDAMIDRFSDCHTFSG